MKNNLTLTRGEVGGDNGEKGVGFSGTPIKDTWTKSRRVVESGEGGEDGWGWGEWWGINANNCT